MKNVFVRFGIVIAIAIGTIALAHSEPRSIPDAKNYQPFLYGDYQPERLNVLIFKDPFCPYCIKAIDKLDDLNSYNVFIFWAPILGQRSVARVDEIFKCSEFASSKVLGAVKQRQSPNCEGDMNTALLEQNLNMVENYQIYSVPEYFVQGKRTSFLALSRNSGKSPYINGVKIDWQRFALMQQQPRMNAKFLTMLVPEEKTLEIDFLLRQFKPEYVFLPPKYAASHPEFLKCVDNEAQCIEKQSKLYAKRSGEFELLFDGALKNEKVVLIDYHGSVSTY